MVMYKLDGPVSFEERVRQHGGRIAGMKLKGRHISHKRGTPKFAKQPPPAIPNVVTCPYHGVTYNEKYQECRQCSERVGMV